MPAREHLIVVIPGIGGSELAPPDQLDRPVWAAGLRGVGNVLLRPERLSLDVYPVLEPVGLVRSRKLFGAWTAVHGYDNLLTRLAALPGATLDPGVPVGAPGGGRNLDATVVAFPYDFRRSIVEAADRLDTEIRRRLTHLWPRDGLTHPRVLIVAHSLGGLVARYWATQNTNGDLLRGLLTLGTPHRGAPKALDILANGVGAGRWRITGPCDVLRTWPSVAELLPRYPAVTDLSQTGASDGEPGPLRFLRPHEVPLPWLEKPAVDAFAVHQAIEKGWTSLVGGPELAPRIGYGHGTLRACTWDGTDLAVTRAEILPGLGDWADDLGDGTVPAYSGLPLEMDRHSPRGLRVAARHGSIVNLDEITFWVEEFEGRPGTLSAIRGEERPVALGLHLDEQQIAGEPFTLAVSVAGVEADVSTTPMWLTVEREDGGPPFQEVRLVWDPAGSVFRGEVSALPPGVHRVRVNAEEVPQAGRLAAGELVEVLDGDALG